MCGQFGIIPSEPAEVGSDWAFLASERTGKTEVSRAAAEVVVPTFMMRKIIGWIFESLIVRSDFASETGHK